MKRIVLLVLALAVAGHCGTKRIWVGTTKGFNQINNWNPNTPGFANDDTLLFDGSSNADAWDSANIRVGMVKFTSYSGTFTLGGHKLTVGLASPSDSCFVWNGEGTIKMNTAGDTLQCGNGRSVFQNVGTQTITTNLTFYRTGTGLEKLLKVNTGPAYWSGGLSGQIDSAYNCGINPGAGYTNLMTYGTGTVVHSAFTATIKSNGQIIN